MRKEGVASRSSWWAQALHNRFIALVLAMVVIIPLVAVPTDNHVGGFAALVFEGFALLLATTLLWRSRFDISRERVLTFLRTGANLPALLLLALATVSCISSPFKAFGIQGVLELGAGVLLYFVVAYQFRQSKHLSMLVDTLLFLAAAVSIIAMGQYTMEPVARATALFGNQQPLGSLLMILLPIVAVIAIADKSRNRQLAAQVITVLTGGSLLLAHTRSAWIGALVAGLVLVALLKFAADNRDAKDASGRTLASQKHKVVLPLVLTVVTLGFAALIMTQSDGVVDRGASLANVSQASTWSGRLVIWQGAFEMIKAKPLTGWGENLYAMYQHSFTGVGTPIVVGGSYVTLSSNAHSLYLQTAAELGLPGLALLLAVIVSFVVTAVKGLKGMDAGIRRTLLMGSIAAVAAFAVDAFSNPSWQFGQVSMFFWLMMGIGTSCVRSRAKHEEEASFVAVSPRLVRPLAVVAAALILSLVVLPTASIAASSDSDYRKPPPGAVRVLALIAAGATAVGLFNAITKIGHGGRGGNGGGNGQGNSNGNGNSGGNGNNGQGNENGNGQGDKNDGTQTVDAAPGTVAAPGTPTQ